MQKTLFKDLIALLKRYRSRYAFASALVIISSGLVILNPLILRQAIIAMDPTAGVPEGFFAIFLQQNLGQSLIAWLAVLFSIAFTTAYLRYRMRYAFITTSRDAERDIRHVIFVRLQEQTQSFYDRYGAGELLSRLTNDITAYRTILGPGIMYPVFFLSLAVPGMAALFWISPPLATLTLVPMFTIPLLNWLLRTPLYHTSIAVQKGLGELSTMCEEHYSDIRVVKSYHLEKRLGSEFNRLCETLIVPNFRFMLTEGLLFPFFGLITKSVTIGLMLFAGYMITHQWNVLSSADFISFMWIQSYIFLPVVMLAWLIPVYERGRSAYDRLLEIYEEPIDIKDTGVKNLSIPANASIEVRDLTFSYPGKSTPALNSFSVHIDGGTFLGITGPIGCGKSTLIKLLRREYEVPKGKIIIGGRDIHDYPLSSFSEAMVSVEQVPFLFSKTIADNIRFGKQVATTEELELVAQYADLHETILEFPERYNTLVGERGVTLSGGQKQRVAMARAFLVDRSILLLDDIFSAVDIDTETRIFRHMRENFKGKTVILITHRVSILSQMDRVIYLDEGRLIEDGSPMELLKREGPFAALSGLQAYEE